MVLKETDVGSHPNTSTVKKLQNHTKYEDLWIGFPTPIGALSSSSGEWNPCAFRPDEAQIASCPNHWPAPAATAAMEAAATAEGSPGASWFIARSWV